MKPQPNKKTYWKIGPEGQKSIIVVVIKVRKSISKGERKVVRGRSEECPRLTQGTKTDYCRGLCLVFGQEKETESGEGLAKKKENDQRRRRTREMEEKGMG